MPSLDDPTGAKICQLLKQFEPKTNKKKRKWPTHTTEALEEADSIAQKFADISNDPSISSTPEEEEQMEETLAQAKRDAIRNRRNGRGPTQITMRELRRAMKKANKKSAKGVDNISNNLLIQCCPENGPAEQLLLKLANHELLFHHTFPSELKTAKIKALPKDKPNEYRPISLLPALAKLLESLIEHRTHWHVGKYITPQQFGGRAVHSCPQAIIRLLHHAGVARAKELQFGLISYDLVKAYDRVPRARVIAKLKKMKTPPYLTLLIDSWLKDRRFFVHHRNVSSKYHQQRNGIPQGSCLSVLVWLIFINDIPLRPKCSSLYVDDGVSFASGQTESQVKRKLRRNDIKFRDWCRTNKAIINYGPNKTTYIPPQYEPGEYIRLGRNRETKLAAAPKTRILGAIIETGTPDNDCGIQLDLEYAATQIKRRCGAAKCLRKYNLPMDRYQSMVGDLVEGALNAITPWIASEAQPEMHKKLHPLTIAYREYLRVRTGAMKTTPIPLLHAMAQKPLLPDKIKLDSSMLVLKAIASDTLVGREYTHWDGHGDGHSPYGSVQGNLPGGESYIHPICPLEPQHLEQLYKCKFAYRTKEEALALHEKGKLLPTHQTISIWTDGSFEHETQSGGAAALAQYHLVTPPNYDTDPYIVLAAVKLANITSSYEGEIVALHRGLVALTTTHIPKREIIVFLTDSCSVITQLESLPLRPRWVSKIVAECVEMIAKLVTYKNKITFQYVPSHEGIGLNDVVDVEAKRARETGELTAHDTMLASYKLQIKKEIRIGFNEYLAEKIQESQVNPSYPSRDWFFTAYEKREDDEGKRRRPPTNCYLNRDVCARAHLYATNIVESPECQHCYLEDESLEHLILECPVTAEQINPERDKYYAEIHNATFNDALWTHPELMMELLRKSNKKGIQF